ncbi:MAG: hypothetical protein JWQ23_524 [Herminiimonas sp.]|nr:hypothetical protein [Herminiimonas sp.]
MTRSTRNSLASPPGVLLILNDVLEGTEDEFNRWYQQQHLPERLAIPGFKRARRYQTVGGQPAYMCVYECDSIDVLSSPQYKERLANPTGWTREVMPNFRNMLRSACRETWSAGDGVGGAAIVVQCQAVIGKEAAARRFLQDDFGPRLMQTSPLVRISLWEGDEAATGGPSAEMALRGQQDDNVNWVLFIECFDLVQMALALHGQILASSGAETGLLIGSWTRYQMLCELHAADVVG